MSEPQAQNQYETYEVKTKLIYYIEENETKEFDKMYSIHEYSDNSLVSKYILFERNNKLYVHIGGSKFLKVWLDKNMNVLFSFVKVNRRFVYDHEFVRIDVECYSIPGSSAFKSERCDEKDEKEGIIKLIDPEQKNSLKIVIKNPAMFEIINAVLGLYDTAFIIAVAFLFARKYSFDMPESVKEED